MSVLIGILGTLLLGTLAGWLGHWALHQRWAGKFYRSHLTHHRLYPPRDLRSPAYRDAKGDSTTFFLVPLVTFVIIAWMVALFVLDASWTVFPGIAIAGVGVGWAHDYLHEAYHLESHWLDRCGWFRSLRALHLIHHCRVHSNIGIVWYGWDRLFRTFRRKSL